MEWKCGRGGGGGGAYEDSRALEAQIVLKVLGDFAHESLKGELAQEQLGRLLVLADLAKRHCSRAITVRLLHRTRGATLARRLCRQLFAWRLSRDRLARRLLCTSHELS